MIIDNNFINVSGLFKTIFAGILKISVAIFISRTKSGVYLYQLMTGYYTRFYLIPSMCLFHEATFTVTADREILTKISEKLVKMFLLQLLVKQFYFNKN